MKLCFLLLIFTWNAMAQNWNEIFSKDKALLLNVAPGVQLALAKKTQLKYTSEKISLLQGMIRVKIADSVKDESEFTVGTENVSFTAQDSEFEVSILRNKNVELDVFEGEVIVSSPHIHTFVPEIVKAKEGFTYQAKKPAFIRRKFSEKFKDHPPFTLKMPKS